MRKCLTALGAIMAMSVAQTALAAGTTVEGDLSVGAGTSSVQTEARGRGTAQTGAPKLETPAPPVSSVPVRPAADVATLEKLKGADIITIDGKMVGSVDRIVRDGVGGAGAVVGVGGFLGIGQKMVIVPASRLHAAPDGRASIDMTAIELEKLPPFDG